MTKINVAEIDILVLDSCAPVSGDCVLQATADHPTHVCICLAPAFVKEVTVTMNALGKLEVANGESTSYVRQPVAKRIADPWPTSPPRRNLEIIRFSRVRAVL